MQIETLYPATSAEIECDGIVPLIIRFGGYDGPVLWAPLYWRTGDFKRSLVEIAVNPASGAMSRIVLVCLPAIENTALFSAAVSSKLGLPGAALSQWPIKSQRTEAIARIDHHGQVTGALAEDELTLAFGNLDSVTLERVVCDRVTFLIDETNRLYGLQVAALSQEEAANLRLALDPGERSPAGTGISGAKPLAWPLKWSLALIALSLVGAALYLVAYAERAPLDRVFGNAESLGIVREATRAEAYRVSPPEEANAEFEKVSPTAYSVASAATPVPPQLARELGASLTEEETYVWIPKACGWPVYGVMISFYQNEERVDVYFCFRCSDLAVVRDGEMQGGADFSNAEQELVRAVKELFPDDAEIQAIK